MKPLIRFKGRVTDFSDQPYAHASVELLDTEFRTLQSIPVNTDGEFEALIQKGIYSSVFVCNKDYAKTKLETWYWDFMALQDRLIHFRFDNVEIYNLKAFIPSLSGQTPDLSVYFRPMSLLDMTDISRELGHPHFNRQAVEAYLSKTHSTEDNPFGPGLLVDHLTLLINGQPAPIRKLTPIIEDTDICFMRAYRLQATLDVMALEEINSVCLQVRKTRSDDLREAGEGWTDFQLADA